MFSLAYHLHYSRFQHSIQLIKNFQQSFFESFIFVAKIFSNIV